MSSLIESLSNRTPIVWVNTLEPERTIAAIPVLKNDDRDLYVFDQFQGLMVWNVDDETWKIVLVDNPMAESPEDAEVSINDPLAAFSYILGLDSCVFIIRNAHKDVDGYLTLFSVLYNRYRDTFLTDDLDKLPTQVVCFAANEPAPPEIAAMTTHVSWGLPTPEELRSLIINIKENYNPDVVDNDHIDEMVRNSVGLNEHDAISVYLESIRTKGSIDPQVLKDLRLARMKAASSLEIDEPKVKLSDVGGLDNAKRLIQHAAWTYRNPEDAAKFGVKPLRRVLLLGLSGCGKSYLCEAAASELGLQLAKTGVSQAMNRFIGQSEENIRNMFDQINAMSPIAVWIDEVGRDLSGGGSSDVVDGGTTSRVHGLFLTKMQELDKGVFVFAAANNIDQLAPEMLRADRFDKLMFVGFPSYEERRDIFALHLPKNEIFDLDQLAEATPCFTGAEIKSLIERTIFDISPVHLRAINTKDIISMIPHQKNRIWIRHKHLAMHMYKNALEEFEWASTSQHAEANTIVTGVEPRHGTTKKVSGALLIK